MPGWSAGSIVSARLASTLKSITIGTISATFVRSVARGRAACAEPSSSRWVSLPRTRIALAAIQVPAASG